MCLEALARLRTVTHYAMNDYRCLPALQTTNAEGRLLYSFSECIYQLVRRHWPV
ncbi:hypothetical protein DPMN_121888 [Dreissena polymorpha]|uniref:Uncharacterized protein n=1 Tax=Dreissena polymorpha TaxID=45954 RepID=A0A9D4JRG9_DREPO|nr:hypothetical protein DPMN_121886 [Dreissena polymorpha]KAH3820144.1 hypothetical protein DPMN_121888 [Dreissena polymorpha]